MRNLKHETRIRHYFSKKKGQIYERTKNQIELLKIKYTGIKEN